MITTPLSGNDLQTWEPMGVLLESTILPDWAVSHVSVPTLESIDEHGSASILFSSRDRLGRSIVGRVEISLFPHPQVIKIWPDPVLVAGNIGCFDDDGAMASSVSVVDGHTYLYYIGWNRGVTVPFRNAIGLARLNENGMYEKLFDGPIVDRNKTEPHFVASSFTCKVGEANFYHWYLSCDRWENSTIGPRHRYNIKFAQSRDGINWSRSGKVAIDYSSSQEYAISRPWVLWENGLWHMWYSYRGDKYQIGYATSTDGKNWERKDSYVNLPRLGTWDSEMVEYPCVFRHGTELFMFYNGNGYGATGMGLAKLSLC